jgi:hypothetical protein
MTLVVKVYDDGVEKASQDLPADQHLVVCGEDRELVATEHEGDGVVVLTIGPKEGAPLARHKEAADPEAYDDVGDVGGDD